MGKRTEFRFWQRWLLFASIYLVLFGLVLALGSRTSLMDVVFNDRIDAVFWPEGNIPENAVTFRAWVYGVLGATVTGWGIFMAFLAHYPFKARERWSWNGFVVSLSVWYVVDTAVSVYFEVLFNVFVNTAIIVVFAIPLAFTRKDFSEQAVEARR
ncbi:MAG TPA: hypothetical protein ENG98_04625 [Actinobacteria bacterium]|nr:hypothetical protein [Actinomycetota bacterium]